MESDLGEYPVKCHCGRVSAQVRCSRKALTVWDCNCSDCRVRRNIHFVVPATDLHLISEEKWTDATTLYEWGTKTAKRRFCKTCGILPFYTPKSNPDGIAVTLPCVDFGNDSPTVIVKKFDGIHWEESFASSNITSESSVK
jgi:hypothetical protein